MNWTLPLPDNPPFRLYVVGHRLVILVEIVKLGDKLAEGKAREIIATESISLWGLTPWALGKGICSMDRMASGGFGHGQSAEKRDGAYLDIYLLCFVRFFFDFFPSYRKLLVCSERNRMCIWRREEKNEVAEVVERGGTCFAMLGNEALTF